MRVSSTPLSHWSSSTLVVFLTLTRHRNHLRCSRRAARGRLLSAGGNAVTRDNDDEEFTLQDGEGDDDENDENDLEDLEEEEMPRLLADARSWDHFRALCYAVRPFTQDDTDCRKERAVEAFNAAAKDRRSWVSTSG